MKPRSKISVIIADSQCLTRAGLKTILAERDDLRVVAEASSGSALYNMATAHQPEVLILCLDDEEFSADDITNLLAGLPGTRLLAITSDRHRESIRDAIDRGITGYVLKTCSREEIVDAVYATARGENFFCSKVLDTLMSTVADMRPTTATSAASCDPVNLSERELEIIRLIAEGNTNRQIAEKLFLSTHTVTTHRKNIMAKLNINNTAGLVMYAVRTNIVSPNRFLFAAD